MPQYTTLNELRNFGANLDDEVRRSILKEARDRSPNGATFLSHSSKDTEFLAGAVRILRNHGAAVYVDKKDDALPPFTNRDTARILRDRITSASKFVLLATPSSKSSKWVPWELGISDGRNRSRNIAIFPGVESSHETTWTETEYLGLYDRVVYGGLEGESTDVWMVWNQEANEAIELSKWIKR